MAKCIQKSNNLDQKLIASMDTARSLNVLMVSAKKKKKLSPHRLRLNKETNFNTALHLLALDSQILAALLKILLKTQCTKCKHLWNNQRDKWPMPSNILVRCQQWTLPMARFKSSPSQAPAGVQWERMVRCIP